MGGGYLEAEKKILKVMCSKWKASSSDWTPDSYFLCYTEQHQLQTNRKTTKQPQHSERSKLTIKVNKKFAPEVIKNHLNFHTTMVF